VDEYFLGRAVGAIVINSPIPDLYNGYHLQILDSPELNAFATPGGHIFLCRGLVEALDSEDALAAVIAHEIAHIQLKHSVEIITTITRTSELSAPDHPANADGGSLWNRESLFDESVWEIANAMLTNGFSQSQEFAADIYALSLLAAAGYNPSSLVDVLWVLESDFSPAGFNRTHPPAAIRIANIQAPLRTYHIQDTRSFRAARYKFYFN
jgi:predicted Zn-dependent protease